MPRVNTAPGEILIANIKNAEVERLAVQKDENHNDRLSVDEAVAVFEAHKGRPPASLQELYSVFEVQHDLQPQDVSYWDAWVAKNWVGDFNVKDWNANAGYTAAGNFRVGHRDVHAPDGAVNSAVLFLADFNYTSYGDFKDQLKGVTLVLSATNFAPEPGKQVPESVELPMRREHSPGYERRNRFGQVTGYVEPNRMALAQVDKKQVQALMGDAQVMQAYLRLDLQDGSSRFVNLNGEAGKNFVIPREALGL
ncbi:MAG: hypothetical protein KC933_17610 [Myxococcales bacterium]|nr:hypothetical protein [Myxococcales bacterium]